MARSGTAVQAASVDDVPRLVSLLLDARADNPLHGSLGAVTHDVLAARLTAFLGRGDGRISLAIVGDQLVGMAIGQRQLPGLFSEAEWLQIEALYVQPEQRRRGTGRVLLGDQLAFAVAQQLPRIVTQPVSGTRSEARFLSRLGFSAVGSRRSVECATLQRRLEHEAPRSGIESLILRRRALTSGTPPRGIPLGVPQEAGEAESSRQVRRAELMRRSASSVTSTR